MFFRAALGLWKMARAQPFLHKSARHDHDVQAPFRYLPVTGNGSASQSSRAVMFSPSS